MIFRRFFFGFVWEVPTVGELVVVCVTTIVIDWLLELALRLEIELERKDQKLSLVTHVSHLALATRGRLSDHDHHEYCMSSFAQCEVIPLYFTLFALYRY